MSQSVQTNRTQYIDINTDLGYDALGGVGRLGRHSMEVLEPGTRQTDRIPGPPKTVVRWFAKLFDRITPSSWRAQGKFRRGLEDFSASVGRLLGHLHNAGQDELPEIERRAELTRALKELAGLRQLADPMTRRGTDYSELLQTRVQRNLVILQAENPQLLREVLDLRNSGQLDEIIAGLDSDLQADMADDLTLIRDALHMNEAAPDTREEPPAELVAAESVQEQKVPEEKPYQSRFSVADLRRFFLENFTFRGHAERALRERQVTLTRFTGEAKELLRGVLEEVDAALHEKGAVDSGHFIRTQKNVEEKMERAIRCATDDVCVLALHHMDRRISAGVDGQDFQRIDKAFVTRELDEIERAIRSGERVQSEKFVPRGAVEVSEDPFQKGIQEARRQIQEISLLYGEITEGLNELERRNSRIENCLLLREIAEQRPPAWLSWQEWGETCDRIIEALQTPVPGNRAALSMLHRMQSWIGADSIPSSLRERFMAALPGMKQEIEPEGSHPVFPPEGTSRAEAKFIQLEQTRAVHQVIGDAGALLQRARLPQADSLIAWGLQISRRTMKLRTAEWNSSEMRQQAVLELRSSISRFMSHLALARMQTVNPTVRSAQPQARNLDADTALEGLGLLQRSVEILVAGLGDEEGGVVSRVAMNDGLSMIEKGEAAAVACGRLLANVAHKETAVAEQLAVCVESGLDDAEASLRGMLEGSRWNKGKHSEAKAAINAFLETLGPVRESRKQSETLRLFAEKLGHNIVPHDAYMGFDGRIHLLINTDRQNMEGASRSVQGTRWVILPEPESLHADISTGVNRLDRLLSIPENRTDFYPEFYRVLKNFVS